MLDYIIIKGKIDYILSSCPNSNNIQEYSTFLKNNNVKYLINLCDSQYSLEYLDNIVYKNIIIQDGTIPNENQLNVIKEICKDCIASQQNIVIHCVSGMGRAPCVLGVLLIEYENYENIYCIEAIRKKRKGSINSVQLKYLMNYKLNKKESSCIIM